MEIFENLKRRITLTAARSYLLPRLWLPIRCRNWLIPLFTSEDKKIKWLLEKSVVIARCKGLRFKPPSIFLIEKGLAQIIRHKRGKDILDVYRALGYATRDGKRILIHHEVLGRNDIELAVIIAHELGHCIDFQTQRRGHPLFDNIGHLDEEMFAHAIAAYIYSKLVVISVYKTVNIPIDDLKLINLNLKC